MRRSILVSTLMLLASGIVVIFAGPLMSQVEQPAYTVERIDGAVELRAYPSLTVAETIVDGKRGPAINKGFHTLASYIFGDNDGAKKIDMTAPVMQGSRSAAANEGATTRTWTIRFVMPRSWSTDSLPRPKNGAVRLEQTPAATFAVIRFSGLARDSLLARKTDELKAYIARQRLASLGEPIYAFYNPPWTLPFLRRNEIMIEVSAPSP